MDLLQATSRKAADNEIASILRRFILFSSWNTYLELMRQADERRSSQEHRAPDSRWERNGSRWPNLCAVGSA
jgi:hypothetical protein